MLVRRQVVLTGDRINDAQPGFDQRNNEPAVHVNLDGTGARIFKEVTRENVGKRMAIVLVEKGKAEVITAPVIREEIGGGRVQISGRMNTREANDIALLMRAGALAAPMEIVEERTVGPSLGKENIDKGFNSVFYGFIVLAIFMCAYYLLMGVISTIALSVNLLLLVALLSMLQATLTLPGIAAIALTLGMAIDSNVLINERIREELRWGATPHAALTAGYERAFGTILDSNVTTLIAGIALLIFGSGPVRGFAVVHCLGIMTSMFSAVFVSRGIVNLIYGGRKHLAKISIGQVWRPAAAAGAAGEVGRGRHDSPSERSNHGILPHPARHPVHAVRAHVQRDLARHVRARRGLPRRARPQPRRRLPRRHGDRGRLRPRRRLQPRARRHRQARARRVFGAELRQLRHRADPPAAQGRRVERAALRARDGRAAGRRPVGDGSSASSSSARRSARSSTRTARSRCCWSRSASSATSRCASSGASRSRRSSPTCTTSSSSWASSRCSSGSSRCRCWRRCSRCWAIRSTSRS